MIKLMKGTAFFLATGMLLGASASAQAGPKCDTYMFAGHTEQSSPISDFEGSMTMTNLANGRTLMADVVTTFLGYTSADHASALTSHRIKSKGSRPTFEVVTFDDAEMTPEGAPGVFVLASHLKVKTGKGAYTCGEMATDVDTSTVDWSSGMGVADYSGFARLCKCGSGDDD